MLGKPRTDSGTLVHRKLHEADDTAAIVGDAFAEFNRRYADTQTHPLFVIVAALDEVENIGPVLDEVPETIAGIPVTRLVVDDGSTDDTAAVSAEHGALVVRLAVNRGHGVALRLGYRIARESNARYIATLDADGQWDPADLPSMIELLRDDKADFVIGSRALGSTENTDRIRNVGMPFFAGLISILTKAKVTDTSSGLRALRAEITGEVTQTQPQYQTSELLIGSILRGYRVAEVPTLMRRRISGHSKKGHNFAYGARYTRVVVTTWQRERRSARLRGQRGSKPAPAPARAHVPAGDAASTVPTSKTGSSS